MTRQALIAEAAGVNLVGEYEQRGTGLAPGGKPARFGCGRTDRVEKEWPVFLEYRKNFKPTPQDVKPWGKGNPKGRRSWNGVKCRWKSRKSDGQAFGFLKLKMALPEMRRSLRNRRIRLQHGIMLIFPIGKF